MRVGVSSRLGSPTVGDRIIFKRVSELAAGQVGATSAHSIKLAIGLEIDAHQDVDCVRHKHIAALPHRDIENRARRRRDAAHGRPAVLIKNAESRSSVLLLWYHTRALVARFSSHQKYDCKYHSEPKNRPYCV